MENARLLLATAGSAFGFSWNPDRDIPSLEGKVILVTGGKLLTQSSIQIEHALKHPRERRAGQGIHPPTQQAQPRPHMACSPQQIKIRR